MSKALDKQLISEYARREQITPKESERRIQIFIDTTRDVLQLTSHVHLRRLGTIYLGERKNARFKNNSTGMIEMIPIIKTIRFRPSMVSSIAHRR